MDPVVAGDDAVRLELREQEGVHVGLKRHAVLQPDRDGDREAVHQRAEGRAVLGHRDEDLAQARVLELARVQVDRVAADLGLLREAGTPRGQRLALPALQPDQLPRQHTRVLPRQHADDPLHLVQRLLRVELRRRGLLVEVVEVLEVVAEHGGGEGL